MTTPEPGIRALVIDNYDSFTYNLCHYLADAGPAEVTVIRNDEPSFAIGELDSFDCVVISPGPGHPANPDDLGICRSVLRKARIPLLGVCLGHQGLCETLGGTVGRAAEPFHGRTSAIVHTGDELFDGIPSPFEGVRYHSLIAQRIPGELEVIARTEDGLPMALRHRELPQWGVQFHPESICTEHGHRLLGNFLRLVDATRPAAPTGTRPGLRPWNRPGATAARPVPQPAPDYVLLTRKLGATADAEAVFSALYADSTHAFWLDDGQPDGKPESCSFMGDAAGPLARTAYADVRSGEVRVTEAGRTAVYHASFFDWMSADLGSRRIAAPPLPFDFALGWVGYLGYELKGQTSGDAAHTAGDPDAAMIFADRTVVFHHGHGETYLLALARRGGEDQARRWLDETADRIAGIRPGRQPAGTGVRNVGRIHLRHGREEYLRLIDLCRQQIADGESYEICLTNLVEVEAELDPWPAYLQLRRHNPVPFGAFLRLPDLAVLSCSPERLLRIGADGVIESKPIKGTRPRGSSPAGDERLRRELAGSIKDRAENLMIVDLVRNDIGSCSQVGSVTVDALFDIETYATVHQMVSTVRGRLRPEVDPVGCVRAVFPAGSMTGAPKVRTMQIIDRLEGGPRGIYSGSVGYFSLSGAVALSVTIRTLVTTPGRVRFGVGGAITALSDPEEEFEETAVKAAPLLRLIGREFPERRRA